MFNQALNGGEILHLKRFYTFWLWSSVWVWLHNVGKCLLITCSSVRPSVRMPRLPNDFDKAHCGKPIHTPVKFWSLRVILFTAINKINCYVCTRRSPQSLTRMCAAARLLGLWARIPLGTWMFVFCECCVLSGRDLWEGPILRAEESYWVCHWVWPNAK
jgi:hypothetical protein